MTRFALLLGIAFTALLLIVLAVAVQAKPEVPPPYAGLKNPFPWGDASAQEAGKQIYQRSCLGCHGAGGRSLAASDFGTPDFPRNLEERPDYYFWILSEGRLDKGMPPFKSSLSEEQRWQVLNYLRSLGTASTAPAATPKPVAKEAGGKLLLTAPSQAPSGQPLTLSAVLQDSRGKPIGGATVKFLVQVDFFARGLMEIGDALTNDQGDARLQYTPREMGETQVVARYQDLEAVTIVRLAERKEPFYRAEAGIKVPAPAKEMFIGPVELAEGGGAPATVLRLPTSGLSWLTPLLLVVIAIWATYFLVIYQVWRIPGVRGMGGTNTRLLPWAGLIIVVALGLLLVLILITSPYSHLHLLR